MGVPSERTCNAQQRSPHACADSPACTNFLHPKCEARIALHHERSPCHQGMRRSQSARNAVGDRACKPLASWCSVHRRCELRSVTRLNFGHMEVTILLFAAARELVDSSSVQLKVPESATTKSLLGALAQAYPVLQDVLKTSVLAVNHKYVDSEEDVPISPQDEIAVIPPVSGG